MFLTYILKASALTAVFTLLYHLLMRKDTFLRIGRAVLVSSLAIAYILPLCRITRHVEIEAHTATVEQAVISDAADMVNSIAPSVAVTSDSDVTAEPADRETSGWFLVLLTAYLAGAAFLICRIAVSIMRVRSILGKCTKTSSDNGITVLESDGDIQPFSWMNYIVLPSGKAADCAILAHEKAHVALRHSHELLLVDILSIPQWFNPAIWLLRRDLCRLHEFEADACVLASGFDSGHYQNVLIGFASASMTIPYTNSFRSSNLKDRILMINRRTSKPLAVLKLAYIPAVITVWLTLTAMTVYVERPSSLLTVDLNRQVPLDDIGRQHIAHQLAYPEDGCDWGFYVTPVHGREYSISQISRNGNCMLILKRPENGIYRSNTEIRVLCDSIQADAAIAARLTELAAAANTYLGIADASASNVTVDLVQFMGDQYRYICNDRYGDNSYKRRDVRPSAGFSSFIALLDAVSQAVADNDRSRLNSLMADAAAITVELSARTATVSPQIHDMIQDNPSDNIIIARTDADQAEQLSFRLVNTGNNILVIAF